MAQNKTEVQDVLTERGNRYGDFKTHAQITQTLKAVVDTYLAHLDKHLALDQEEALDMIFHKIGRIVNGDPNYIDSWVDIAGYSQLIVNRLQSEQTSSIVEKRTERRKGK